MSHLDPRLRCGRCGTPFDDEPAAACPRCGADPAAVGSSSELRDWAVTRREGRTRYVWRRWVLLYGGGLTVSKWAIMTVMGERDPMKYAFELTWPLLGYLVGRQRWRESEREYAAWSAGRDGRRGAQG